MNTLSKKIENIAKADLEAGQKIEMIVNQIFWNNTNKKIK